MTVSELPAVTAARQSSQLVCARSEIGHFGRSSLYACIYTRRFDRKKSAYYDVSYLVGDRYGILQLPSVHGPRCLRICVG